MSDLLKCPICDKPFKAGDICASDISEGACHAECLAGSPVVDLDTGEEVDGAVMTFPFEQEQTPPPEPHVLPPVVTGQMEIEPDVTAADLGVNAEPSEPDDLREEMRLAAASIRQWMPETLPANEAGQIHFARLLAESAAEAIEQYLATTEGSDNG